MRSMTLVQLAKFGRQKINVKDDRPVLGVSVDSRTLKPGELFFALPGEKVDGHVYLEDVAAKGAAGAVVAKSYQGPDFGLPLIHVKDTLQLLQDVAKHLLAKHNPRIIAVTGSVGKTTTKDFVTTLLSQKYKVSATPGNSNSQIGIPLAIINSIQGDEDLVVIEMGMTKAGNIANLIKIAPPDVALITSVDLVHACNFDRLEDIGLAKAEILSHPKTQMAFISHDIKNYVEISRIGACRKTSFSISSSKAGYFLKSTRDKIKIVTPEEEATLGKFDLPGKHNQHNFLAAVAVARYFNLSWEEIERGMKQLALPERRLQRVEKNGVVFINDSYNACTISLKAALQSLPKPTTKGKRIAVIGEMLELGKFSEQCHLEVGECALENVDKVYCLGKGCEPIFEQWKKAEKPVEWTLSLEELVNSLRSQLKTGDVVLLKGSRANGLWKVLETI